MRECGISEAFDHRLVRTYWLFPFSLLAQLLKISQPSQCHESYRSAPSSTRNKGQAFSFTFVYKYGVCVWCLKVIHFNLQHSAHFIHFSSKSRCSCHQNKLATNVNLAFGCLVMIFYCSDATMRLALEFLCSSHWLLILISLYSILLPTHEVLLDFVDGGTRLKVFSNWLSGYQIFNCILVSNGTIIHHFIEKVGVFMWFQDFVIISSLK